MALRTLFILGAGFDSHAYRCQDLLANVRVFEVDRPATQAFKKQRVLDALGEPPANLTYVPIDIQHEDSAPSACASSSARWLTN
jgi:O-methyltransferase involved in polyketide biosynthesis